MTWQSVQESDVGRAKQIMRNHMAGAMFPLDNLINIGLSGPTNTHKYAMRIWQDADRGLLCVTRSGTIFPLGSEATGWDRIKPLLAGQKITGIIGTTSLANAVCCGLNLEKAPMTLEGAEPQYRLDLDQFDAPLALANMELTRIEPSHRSAIEKFRADYLVEVLGEPKETAQSTARAQIEHYVRRDTHRVLLEDGVPIAMTGVNAQVEDWVQIGGVYTPPEARGHGHARHALGLHLVEMRAKGVTVAVLSAANETAARMYEALGFTKTGRFSMTLFATPQVLT